MDLSLTPAFTSGWKCCRRTICDVIGKKWTDSFYKPATYLVEASCGLPHRNSLSRLVCQGRKGRPDQQIPQVCLAVRFPCPTQKFARTHCVFARPAVASFQGLPLSGKTSKVRSLWWSRQSALQSLRGCGYHLPSMTITSWIKSQQDQTQCIMVKCVLVLVGTLATSCRALSPHQTIGNLMKERR